MIAFVYDFPHAKSVLGLLRLATLGLKVKCLAAPKKTLTVKHSLTRVTPIISALHPRDVAKVLGFEYIQVDHDSPGILEHIDQDLGIILGARILKPHVVSALPIINLHPGLLPHNRGLDNLKWAIIHNLPQAVTTHIIDRHIDMGYYLTHKIIDVYPDDTLLDIHLRLQATELDLIGESIDNFKSRNGCLLSKGTYRSAMPNRIDKHLKDVFQDYKDNYEVIRSRI